MLASFSMIFDRTREEGWMLVTMVDKENFGILD